MAEDLKKWGGGGGGAQNCTSMTCNDIHEDFDSIHVAKQQCSQHH